MWLAAAWSAYLPGDPVPIMRRMQHSGRRTAWHEVSHRAAPRFLTDRRSSLDSLPDDVPNTEPFKMCARDDSNATDDAQRIL